VRHGARLVDARERRLEILVRREHVAREPVQFVVAEERPPVAVEQTGLRGGLGACW